MRENPAVGFHRLVGTRLDCADYNPQVLHWHIQSFKCNERVFISVDLFYFLNLLQLLKPLQTVKNNFLIVMSSLNELGRLGRSDA